MLVAEVMATFAGKKLDFGDWEGDDAGRTWAGELRELIGARDVDAPFEVDDVTEGEERVESVVKETHETKPPDLFASRATSGYDSDDSLTGYASPTSSRSPSPTPSELKEMEKDPTLHVGIKKVSRPVYLAQLGEMVRSTSGLQVDPHEQALKVEMALDCAEVLVRRKRDYGTELGASGVS
jgi:telomere length regulation protein